MAITLTLTSEPTPVTEAGYPNGALIYNTGASDAYASEDPGGQVTGFPVPAGGGSLTWDAGRPLYLAAGPGQTTTVSVDDNSSSTVSSPTDLANAIIGAGLAQDIAQQISLKGAPSIDNPQILSDGVFQALPDSAPYDYAWSVGNPAVGQAPIDVTSFQSVTVAFLANIAGGGTENMVWQIQFFSDAAGTKGEGAYYGQMMLSGSMNAVVPASGRYMSVILAWQGGQITVPPSFFFTLTGSYRSVPEYRFSVLNDLWEKLPYKTSPSQGGDCAIHFSIPSGVNTTYLYPSYSNLPAQVTAYCGTVSSSQPLNITFSDLNTNFLGGFHAMTSTDFNQCTVYNASSQMKLAITNTSGATFTSNLYLNLSYQRA